MFRVYSFSVDSVELCPSLFVLTFEVNFWSFAFETILDFEIFIFNTKNVFLHELHYFVLI